VWAIPAPKGGNRAFCDRMNDWAKGEGQPGLAYIFWRKRSEGVSSIDLETLAKAMATAAQSGDTENAEKLRRKWLEDVEAAGPVARSIGVEQAEAMRVQLGLGVGDAVFFVAGRPKDFIKFAGLARNRIGNELGLIQADRFEFCWIVDFPMYEWNEEEKKIDFSHNPFSMPNATPEQFLALDPADHEKILALKAIQYDIVCNGIELSSGAIRNHQPDLMKRAFEIAGYGEDVLLEKFGGMYRAFQYGAPPHGGIAPGVDRIVMMLAGEENLREIVLFPMNQRAEDLLMGAPSEATMKQLRELHIRLNLPAEKTA
jgi:aspartyl-tRNA synthetase